MINTEVLEEKSTLITRLTELAESGKYVFRGYSKQDQLQPNIIRKKLVFSKFISYKFRKSQICFKFVSSFYNN